MNEIWKDVINYEGIYQVSNLGRVKSLSRKVWCVQNNSFSTLNERILKPSTNSFGYKQVVLSINTIKKTKTVHQLVAVAFLGHIPIDRMIVVNHKDFNKTNNRVENLEIVTARENSNLKHIKSSSKYVGVSWNKAAKKWMAYITIKKRMIHLGLFTNEYDAHLAHQNKLKTL